MSESHPQTPNCNTRSDHPIQNLTKSIGTEILFMITFMTSIFAHFKEPFHKCPLKNDINILPTISLQATTFPVLLSATECKTHSSFRHMSPVM